MGDTNTTMSFSLPASLEAEIRAIAERDGRPVSWVARDLLQRGIDELKAEEAAK